MPLVIEPLVDAAGPTDTGVTRDDRRWSGGDPPAIVFTHAASCIDALIPWAFQKPSSRKPDGLLAPLTFAQLREILLLLEKRLHLFALFQRNQNQSAEHHQPSAISFHRNATQSAHSAFDHVSVGIFK